MDSPRWVSDDAIQFLAAAYIDAWNGRDRDAWLALLHPELEFSPTAMVDTRVYHGIDGAAGYFATLVSSDRPERARIVGLRRLDPDRFLIELELVIDESPVANACVIARIAEGTFIETRGYLSDLPTLASIGAISEQAPVIGGIEGHDLSA